MGVDVSMTPVRPVAVSGTLTDDLGPLADFGVQLFTHESDARTVPFQVARTSTDAGGRFVFPLVPPGAYRVVAWRLATTRFGPDVVLPPPGPPRAADRVGASAEQSIVVGDQDVSGLALQLGLGVQVSGRVEFRGKRPGPETMRQLLVFVSQLDPASHSMIPRPYSVNPDAKDSFAIRDIAPGQYVVSINDRPEMSLLAVTIGGKDVTERPLTIEGKDLSDVIVVLTDRPAEITGTVRLRAGSPDSDAGVVLFPTDRTRWSDVRNGARMFRSARVSRTGTFSFKPVLPGEYFVAALADDATAEFPDTKFLDALTAVAQTIRVEAGAAASVTLTTVDAPVVRAPLPLASDLSTDVPQADDFIPSGPYVDEQTQATPPAQKPSVTVVLTGIVTTDETPATPLRRAIVTATVAELKGSRQVVTSDDGRFTFADLPPGRYSLVVDKPGYVKTFYGNKRPGGMPATPVAVLAGQPAPDITIRIPRGAVVAGAVRDQFGTPLSGVLVSVKHVAIVDGTRRMTDVPNLRVPVTTTDDQGRYRIYGLPPGEYAVFCELSRMNPGNVRETNSADVDAVLRELRAGRSAAALAAPPPRQVSLSGGYLPGVPDAGNAQLITLALGEERVGADILIGPLRALTVSGTSVGPGGAPMSNLMLVVVNTGTGARIVAGSGGARDGRFTLSALPAGRYVLVGRAAENNAGETVEMPYFAETEFVLTDQNLFVTLQFERGTTIEGRIVPPAGAAPGAVESVRLGATPVDGHTSVVPARVVATTRPDGTFVFDGVGPGKWRVTGASLPPIWSLRSAVLDGRDTLDVPIDVRPGQAIADLTVTMTDRPAVVTGTILDASGQPTSEYSIVAFSTDRALWSVPRRVSSVTRLSSDGRFTITGLPPGEYYLAVSADLDPAQLGEVSFLESLVAAAEKITIAEGERKVQDFRIR
jgi:Carboxypeptidase regulatory-like domain